VRSEREKMLAGELYDPLDPELVRARDRARNLCQDLNATREAQQDERQSILRELFGAGGKDVWMQPPFFCDYGSNILLGKKCFFTKGWDIQVTFGKDANGKVTHLDIVVDGRPSRRAKKVP
jgi:maltose acetyltransferase-like protein